VQRGVAQGETQHRSVILRWFIALRRTRPRRRPVGIKPQFEQGPGPDCRSSLLPRQPEAPVPSRFAADRRGQLHSCSGACPLPLPEPGRVAPLRNAVAMRGTCSSAVGAMGGRNCGQGQARGRPMAGSCALCLPSVDGEGAGFEGEVLAQHQPTRRRGAGRSRWRRHAGGHRIASRVRRHRCLRGDQFQRSPLSRALTWAAAGL